MGLRGPIPKDSVRRQGHRRGRDLTIVPPKSPAETVKNSAKSAKNGAKTAILKAPNGLLPASRRIWKAFWQSPVSHAVDLDADRYRIERWINTVDEYERVNSAFRNARIVKGSTGQPALNPLASYLQQLLAEINKAEAELGLTPLARMRLGIAYGEAKLTALELARALDEVGEVEIEPGLLEGDWEAV